MNVVFDELYVCYDTITKKCICISREEFLMRRYISKNKIEHFDIFKVTGDNFIERYESAYGSYELEEYGSNVMTAKEKMVLLDMIKEDAHKIKSVSLDILRIMSELNLNEKERLKLAKAYKTLDSLLESKNLRRVMDLDTLYENSKIKNLIEMEKELRGEIDDEINLDEPMIIFI
ncbi:hypothetical protein [Romboutsia ilealis]|uniref:hypothetical protein n=1 Tax=Romboutsia ilealis TaxID=1115758 RepID=UPI00272A6746|nr:hypothetical protein [Romboutsia ilealis]